MGRFIRCLSVACVVASLFSTAAAQTPAPPPEPPAQQKPEQKPDKKDAQKPEEPQKYEETVVVTGSRTEQKLVNTPVTMSVVTSERIESAPSQNFAELLRSVPGLNVTQVSARDINLTTRSATGTLATGQLALLDGRSVYQDFFGFVMWDFLPVNLHEIKQIEVIRGPASAVWGANALNGVVNVITKSPREMQGSSAVIGVGMLDRTTDSRGSLFYLSGTHAQAVNDRVAYKISAGVYSQDPPSRPTGTIPCDAGPALCSPTRVQYPPFANTGTTQPKFDARLDYDYPDGRKLSFSGGVAGTEGIMHSGIGPFDINNGSTMSYGKVNFSRQGFRAAFFTNILDGNARNLLTRTPANQPINFSFATRTFDFEASNAQTFGTRHLVNYGGNLRFNRFDLSLAPNADDRTEFGIYAQDDIFINDHLRLSLGGRLDRFDYLDDFVFSPRAALMIKPQEDHTFRVSFNRAYRSPSVVNNFLDVTIAEPINMGLFSPLLTGVTYLLPVKSVGNTDLTEQSVDAYEVGYTGIFRDRTVFTAAYYVNKSKNDIFFTEVRSGRWTHTNPPPGWPITPLAIAAATGGAGFPGLFTYQNFGELTQKGLELGVDSAVHRNVNVYANYSFQAEPEPDGFPLSELNIPAEHRFNAGIGFNTARYLGNLSISYSDAAFWQDVLDARYSGTTKAYTLVNAGFGYKWNERFTTSIKAVNLANEDVQQHVFGDVMKRQLIAELRMNFAR
ncbi:MAG TPA: TonB-dependent receptor [Vicinamibacterales bacterium]|nr:TonB-dependent receptor [Vicinamibacterales bacterium]